MVFIISKGRKRSSSMVIRPPDELREWSYVGILQEWLIDSPFLVTW
jgi:hypothetical protein